MARRVYTRAKYTRDAVLRNGSFIEIVALETAFDCVWLATVRSSLWASPIDTLSFYQVASGETLDKRGSDVSLIVNSVADVAS